jgi:hypothetical protein
MVGHIGFSLKLIVANARPSATGSSLKLDWFNQSTSGHCEPAFLSLFGRWRPVKNKKIWADARF